MEKEKTKFCAPLLNAYRWHESSHYRNGLPEPYSQETMTALDELFKMVQGISPYNKTTGLRKLFIPVDRGTVEDFRNYCGYYDEEDEISPEELDETWKRDYPDEKQWFSFAFIEDDENGYRGIVMHPICQG